LARFLLGHPVYVCAKYLHPHHNFITLDKMILLSWLLRLQLDEVNCGHHFVGLIIITTAVRYW